MKKLILILLTITMWSHSKATTYYAKPNGGTGTGLDSNAQAWSLSKANSMLAAKAFSANDKLLFQSGATFSGQLTIPTQMSHIYIGKYGTRANPLFDNTTELTNWTQVGTSSVYWAPLSATIVNGVSLDGAIQNMGRYPNGDTSYIQYTSSTTNSITGTGVGSLPVNFVGAEMVMKKQRYILDRVKVTAISGNTITFRKDSKYGDASGPPSNNDGFFMQGHLSTLDKEGEWFFDSTAQRFYMHFGTGSGAGRTVKINLVNTVNLSACSFITFENIDFFGGEKQIVMFSCDSISIVNCNFKNTGVAVYGNFCTRTLISGGSVSYCYVGGTLFDDRNDNSKITGVNYYYCGMYPGLGNSGDYSLNALLLNGDGNTITLNTIKKSGFNGIYFEGSNILVQYNLVDSFCIHKDDGGGIYTWTNLPGTSSSVYIGQMVNRVIRDNIVTNSIGCRFGALMDGNDFGVSSCIYLDGYSNHTTVLHNYIAHGCFNGIYMNSNSDNFITDNTVFDNVYALHIDRTVSRTPNPVDTYVRNLSVTGNQFIARTASQMTLLINLYADDNPSLFGNFNNNYHTRPIQSTGSIIDVHKWFNSQNTPGLMNLATWKSTYSQDVSSVIPTVTISNLANFKESYNATTSQTPLSLGAVYKDVTGATFTNSLNLPAYSGFVGIYYAALGGRKVLKTLNQKGIRIGGKLASVVYPDTQLP